MTNEELAKEKFMTKEEYELWWIEYIEHLDRKEQKRS